MIPSSLDRAHISNIDNKFSLSTMQAGVEKEEPYAKEKIIEKIPSLFGNVRIKKIETLWKPVWLATYKSQSGERIEKIDAI